MEINHNHPFVIGDWIKGKYKNGELLIGYIESIDSSTLKVKVMECDDNSLIGREVKVTQHQVEKLSFSASTIEIQLRQLIDVALLTKDKEWFVELSTKLKQLQERKKDNPKVNQQSDKNRIQEGNYHN